jgi:hypothetical protein
MNELLDAQYEVYLIAEDLISLYADKVVLEIQLEDAMDELILENLVYFCNNGVYPE